MIFCQSKHHLTFLNICMTQHSYQINSILLIHIANGYKLLPDLRYWSFGECHAVHFYNVSISSDKLHSFLTTNSQLHTHNPSCQWWITPFFLLNMEINAMMKQRPSCTKVKCRHQGVSCGQLQKTVAPDWLTGIASFTADQSDVIQWHLPGNYSRGLCSHIPNCRLNSDGLQQRASHPAVMAKGDVSAVHRNPCRGLTGSMWLRTGNL